MNNIEWITPKRRQRSTNDEVVVSITKTAKDERTYITFFNNSFMKITDGKYILVGISGNRMYFKESSSYSGYALSKQKNGSRRVSLPGTKETFAGGYNLNFDSENKIWFVEKKGV